MLSVVCLLFTTVSHSSSLQSAYRSAYVTGVTFLACDISVMYTPCESTFNGLQFCRRHYGSIFIHLAVVASRSREIPTKFDLTAVQGHSRSSILVSIDSSCAISYQSLMVTLAVFAAVFKIDA